MNNTELRLGPNPYVIFSEWYALAHKSGIKEPTAMALATLGQDMQPHVRMVLLKDHGERGFSFFTNYKSGKAQDLESHPKASLLFFWETLGRQIRIEGAVQKLGRSESEQYFKTRPRGSQIGAWASPQSKPLKNRRELEAKIEELELKFKDQEVPLPEQWGGYLLVPNRYEFWEGRESRLHERFVYTKTTSPECRTWMSQRLAP